jgi:hypothetical protein|tara:strand:- start:1521 stop:1928 length:408 start_codon:yes stop_codon:yes gene_type:complete
MFDYFTGLLKIPSNPPSFLNDSQMWQSIESGETNTRSYWENGYVLTDNPDGTINAQPKYTTGIPPVTLRQVPTVDSFQTEMLGPGGTEQPSEMTFIGFDLTKNKKNKSKTIVEVMPFWYVPISLLSIYGLYKIVR